MSSHERIGRQAWLTLTVTSAAVFMVSVEITIIAPALPEIRDAFPGTSTATLSWVITVYNIGVARCCWCRAGSRIDTDGAASSSSG